MPPRAGTLTDDDERDPTHAGKPADGIDHVHPVERDDFGAHRLRHLNVLDEPALYRGVDTIRALVRSLYIYAVPV